MSTTFPAVTSIQRRWIIVDATGQVLGRLATRISIMLRGKDKPTFTPFLDIGDFVVVINAKKVRLTGQKASQKFYRRYSGYPGGLKTQTAQDLLDRYPDRIIVKAVKGMLPDGPLGRKLLGKLKVYAGPAHPHGAQRPAAYAPVARKSSA